jgi:mono/diheme cytochrome c family protein
MVILLVLLSAGSSRSENSREEPGNPAAGMNLFLDKGCMHCHSVWESTGGKKGPNLASVGMGRNLYELCASIWSHWSKMNAAKEANEAPIILSRSEIRDIVAYLYYLNYYREPGDKERGKEIFTAQACSRCHALEPMSKEGKPGPAVYAMSDFQGPISLAVALWNHGGGMLTSMSQKHIPWPELKPEEVADLVSYIRSNNSEVEASRASLLGNPVRGQELFVSRYCSGCHKPGGEGPGIGPALASTGTAASLSALVSSLWNHYPKMTQAMASKGISRSEMTTADMNDLIAYVYWVRAYGLAGDPAAGQDLYQTKNCAACHSKGPNGTASAPSLVGSETTKSPYAMLAAIWNHGPTMKSHLEQRKIAWPSLTGEEMRDLIAYFQKPPPGDSK